MIIFRFSFCLIFAAFGVSGCEERAAAPDTVAQLLPKPDPVKVEVDGEAFSYREFMLDYELNPNSVTDEFLVSGFTVRGQIAELRLYDPYRDLLNGVDNNRPKPSYMIPLQNGEATGDPVLDPNVDLSIWFKEFSREEAAKLRVGQPIAVKCQAMRIVGQRAITFDDCELISSGDEK